jgi:hypothetical protein
MKRVPIATLQSLRGGMVDDCSNLLAGAAAMALTGFEVIAAGMLLAYAIYCW